MHLCPTHVDLFSCWVEKLRRLGALVVGHHHIKELMRMKCSCACWCAASVVDYDTMRQDAGKAIQAKVKEVRGYVGQLHKAEAAAKDTLKMYAVRGCSVDL